MAYLLTLCLRVDDFASNPKTLAEDLGISVIKYVFHCFLTLLVLIPHSTLCQSPSESHLQSTALPPPIAPLAVLSNSSLNVTVPVRDFPTHWRTRSLRCLGRR